MASVSEEKTKGLTADKLMNIEGYPTAQNVTVDGVTWFKEDSYKNTAYHKLYEVFAKASKKQSMRSRGTPDFIVTLDNSEIIVVIECKGSTDDHMMFSNPDKYSLLFSSSGYPCISLSGQHHDVLDLLVSVLNVTAGLKPRTHDIVPHPRCKAAHRMIAEFDSAGLVFAAFLTGNAIHILSADRTDPFQHIHHAVNRCHPDAWILHGCLVINLLAAGAVFLQNDVQQSQTLLCDSASLILQLPQDLLFLHLCCLVAYLFRSGFFSVIRPVLSPIPFFCRLHLYNLTSHTHHLSGNGRHSFYTHRRTGLIFRSFCPLPYCEPPVLQCLPVRVLLLQIPFCHLLILFPRATSQVAMLAWRFGDCREDQISRCLQRGI